MTLTRTPSTLHGWDRVLDPLMSLVFCPLRAHCPLSTVALLDTAKRLQLCNWCQADPVRLALSAVPTRPSQQLSSHCSPQRLMGWCLPVSRTGSSLVTHSHFSFLTYSTPPQFLCSDSSLSRAVPFAIQPFYLCAHVATKHPLANVAEWMK